jgi:hypothetical protein
VPGQPAVDDQALAGGRDIVLQLVDDMVDLVVKLRIQVELERRHGSATRCAGGPPAHLFVVSRRLIIGAFVTVTNLRTGCCPSRRPVDVTVPQADGPGVYRRIHPRGDARSRRH